MFRHAGCGDVTVVCGECNAVLLDSVKIERFLGLVVVCPACKTHCDPSATEGAS
jgi:phage FluMu protein Com